MVAMAKLSGRSSKARFAAYVEKLTEVIGHADRAGPLRDYCTGLVMPAERKSVEPMAAVTAPARVAAQHQSLLHGLGAQGDDDAHIRANEPSGDASSAWCVSPNVGSRCPLPP